MSKKIDRIYITEKMGVKTVVVHFDNNTTREFTSFKTTCEAMDFMKVYEEKYGMSEAYEKRFQEWANFSEDKHPMSK